MSKVEEYRERLRQAPDRRAFLLTNSNLPGPRGNLELAQAFTEEASLDVALEYAQLTSDEAPENTPEGFLAFCGIIALGRFAKGDGPVMAILKERASDPRWRVREAVAMALQRVGDVDMVHLLTIAEEWVSGNEYEQRAAIAGICEPRLLREHRWSERVLGVLTRATGTVAASQQRRSEAFRVLKQALGYCWSVAIAAYPDRGREAFSTWLTVSNADIRWILRENLKKKRIAQVDPTWAAATLAQLE